ncbi:MAG TPA: Yip1 family protein [Caulobacteraceae bacterium]|jgi:hypothetical protein
MTVAEAAAGRRGLVDRAKNILLKPKSEWEVIDAEPSTVGGIYAGYVAILAAIPAVCTFLGGQLFGYGMFGVSWKPPIVNSLVATVVTYALTLAMVYVLALIIEFLAPNFGGQKNRLQAFKVAAYSGTAGWVAGVLMLVPALSMLAVLASLYGLYLLWLGLPRLMKVEQDKALPYVAITVVAAIAAAIVISLVTAPLVAATHMGAAAANAGAGGSVRIGDATVNLGELERAGREMEAAAERMERGQAAVAVPAASLSALLPASVAGWSRSETSSGSGGIAGLSGAGAQAVYTAGEGRIELSVTDLGEMGALATMGGALNVEANEETASGYERIGKVNGRMTTEKYDRTDRSGEYGFLVGDRFMVQATGQNVTMDQLKAATGSVDVRRLETLARN